MQISKLRRAARSGGATGETWVAPFLSLVALIFLSDMVSGPGRTLLPVYGEAVLRRPPYFTSTLVSLQLIFGAVSALAGGALSDALGHKRALIVGLSGVPLVGLGFVVHSPAALVLFWTYIGFAFGSLTVGRQSYMMASVPARHLGTATALVFFGLTLGSALGNYLAAPVLDRYGFGVLGAGMTAIALVALLVGFWALPNVGAREERPSAAATLTGYRDLLRRRPVQLLAVIRFVPTAYWGTATLLMPLLIYRVAGTPSAAAYYGTISLLFASACQLLSGRVADRWGVRSSIVVLTGLIAAFSLLTGAFSQSLTGLYVFGMLGAGAAWSLSVTIPGLVHGIVPREEHGRTLGLVHVAWCAGSLTGTQLGGWLVDLHSGLPFFLMGALCLAAVGSAALLGPWLRAGVKS
ncbi:MAG: MFS transporter [Anaerolineae bacterium]|nr:MFS transporter [Anaerolineae bacterium]